VGEGSHKEWWIENFKNGRGVRGEFARVKAGGGQRRVKLREPVQQSSKKRGKEGRREVGEGGWLLDGPSRVHSY